jgi:hypothetical protein
MPKKEVFPLIMDDGCWIWKEYGGLSFPKSDEEDESSCCGSDDETEDSDRDNDSDVSSNNRDDVQAVVVGRGDTKEYDLNEEDLAISDDAADLHRDAAASFSFSSLVNALSDPLDDDNEVLNDPGTIEYLVTVESLDLTWFNSHIYWW